MEEGWSELRPIGNTSTFSSQSSWIAVLGEGEKKNYLMHAYRWIAGEGTSSTMIAPVLFADGIAYYDYFPKILYNDRTGDMVPLYQLLSGLFCSLAPFTVIFTYRATPESGLTLNP